MGVSLAMCCNRGSQGPAGNALSAGRHGWQSGGWLLGLWQAGCPSERIR